MMQPDEQTHVEILERRKEPRKKVLIHAFVSDRKDIVDLKCVIREISKGGCRIASSYVEDLPRIIDIVPEGFDKPMTGKIIWRTSKLAGIQFLSAAEEEAFEKENPPQVHEYKPVGFFERLLSMASLRRRSGQATSDEYRKDTDLPGYGARVMHGLRQPLTAIKSLLDLLMSDAVRPIPKRARSVINAARKNADYAETLLDDALQAGSIESGKLPCNPVRVEIVDLVRDAALVNTGFAAKYEVRFEVKDDVGKAMVKADPARLQEVLANLLSSAAKFSPIGETVTVAVTRDDGSIRVCVSDRGAGTNVWHGDADGKHVTPDGNDDIGTGLDICRAVLKQHGSSLHLDCQPGTGTTAWFELPEIV